jgi:putative acetyltransferase
MGVELNPIVFTHKEVPMKAIIIRTENSNDLAAIHAVNAAAFPTDAEARLVDALRDAKHLLVSLVAEVEGRVVGHIAFSPVTLNDIQGGVGLAPVAVLPEHQRQHIGSQLIREGLSICTKAGYAFVVVLGAPKYYSRFGFVRASQYGLGNDYGVDAEFMVQALRPDGLPATSGVVHYAPEFALVS